MLPPPGLRAAPLAESTLEELPPKRTPQPAGPQSNTQGWPQTHSRQTGGAKSVAVQSRRYPRELVGPHTVDAPDHEGQ